MLMLIEYSEMMSIIFAVCSFGVVHSQAVFNSPYSYAGPSQSASYLGAGPLAAASSGTSTAYSGTGASSSGSAASSSGSLLALPAVGNAQLQPSVPPAADLSVPGFAHYVKQLLSNSYVLNAVPDFVVTDALISKVGKRMFDEKNIQEPGLVELLAKTFTDVGPITKDLYLKASANTLAKMLYLTNALTQETALTYPRILLSYVESYGIRNGISDAESVMQAVGSGFLDFITYIRLLNIPNIKFGEKLFRQEVRAVAGGEEI